MSAGSPLSRLTVGAMFRRCLKVWKDSIPATFFARPKAAFSLAYFQGSPLELTNTGP